MFPWKYGNGPSPFAVPHPTSNKAQTVGTAPLLGGGTGWVRRAPPCPWPATVALATQSLTVGTARLWGALPVWAVEGGERGQGRSAAALLRRWGSSEWAGRGAGLGS